MRDGTIALRLCTVCRAFTDGNCADCEIDRLVVTPVCNNPRCRDAHELRCSRPSHAAARCEAQA